MQELPGDAAGPKLPPSPSTGGEVVFATHELQGVCSLPGKKTTKKLKDELEDFVNIAFGVFLTILPPGLTDNTLLERWPEKGGRIGLGKE